MFSLEWGVSYENKGNTQAYSGGLSSLPPLLHRQYPRICRCIGSTSLLHRSSRLCGTPQRSGSSTVQSLPCTRPLAPISRPTGSGRCRTSKSWMPNIRPFPRRKTGSTPATRKRRSNCVNSAPHNRTWKPSSARRSAATPYRSRRSNEQHSDGSMCE